MSFIKISKFFLTLSAILVIASLVLLFVPGPKLSMEFTGGTLMNVSLPADKTKEDLVKAFESFRTSEGKSLGNSAISITREGTALIRIRDITNEEHLALLAHLKRTTGDIQEQQFTTIGPTVGQTLKQRSIEALIVASIGIVVYIAIAFRKVPRKLSPWRFGFFAVLAMVHDIIITSGIFVVLGSFTNFEMDTLFVTALLTLLGYSVNDTIVIFDRIRDNLTNSDRHEPFEAIVVRSLRQSISRTLNTGLGALIMLSCLFFFGPDSIHWFMLALIVGTVIGTYSSFFVASPLLIFWRKKE